MKLYITLSKKSLAVLSAAVVTALVIALQVFSAKALQPDGSTNALRVSYLKSLEYAVDDSDVCSKEIIIPRDFGDVYTEYNRLQKESGFDLLKYKGKSAMVYTYALAGSERQIHLIVCDGKIIGGDVADLRLDGEMEPLRSRR